MELTSTRLSKKNVFIIDNDENSSAILKSRLIHAGYSVDISDDCVDALERITRKPPQLILLDIKAEGIDGYDILWRIRELRKLRGVPIFVFTSESKIDTVEKALNLGANNYIVKPFNPHVVVEKIKKATRRK